MGGVLQQPKQCAGFPAHRLKIPPQVPLAIRRGRVGGARWDDWRTGCHLPAGGAASRPMCQLAWRSGCSAADRTITSSGGPAADVPPSEPKVSDWRGGRAADRWLCSGKAAAGTSLHPVFSGPAPGMAGDRGGVRDASTERSDLRAGPIAKRASVRRSMTDGEARDPRARERAAVVNPAGNAGHFPAFRPFGIAMKAQP